MKMKRAFRSELAKPMPDKAITASSCNDSAVSGRKAASDLETFLNDIPNEERADADTFLANLSDDVDAKLGICEKLRDGGVNKSDLIAETDNLIAALLKLQLAVDHTAARLEPL